MNRATLATPPKSSTHPVSSHISVLCPEAMRALAIKKQGAYLDATFGRGGYSRQILDRLDKKGRLLAFDRDPAAISAGQIIQDIRFTLTHRPFSELRQGAVEAGFTPADAFDGIVFDLGISSPQVDDGSRGFSFRHDGPLDMRMDTTRGETAGEWLARANLGEITEVLKNYGNERFARRIAEKIVATRAERPLVGTGQLATLVHSVVRGHEPGQDPATRTFQGIRIHVNQELQEIRLALPQALELLKPGGRLAVVAFHSLEDRLVKHFMREAANPAANIPRHLPIHARDLPKPRLRVLGKPVRPSPDEVSANPRARSATLRVAEKLAGNNVPKTDAGER
ncbi:MAG: 16S rRNA (cytosine(1402)-N(4))-methyltransferase RsmH [Zoogloeaceae bacterium]|jgi:16S rRNA (cytosine1402-N4)-methyltransferase|nr:16S rRNA (cytosine(1402)-N(4))-methyltransferase RsmH [Zoogloeaceae bacterium]